MNMRRAGAEGAGASQLAAVADPACARGAAVADPVEPLVLRVRMPSERQGSTAIVFRTYASRPIRRGRTARRRGVRTGSRPPGQLPADRPGRGLRKSSAATGDSLSCDFAFDLPTQTLDVEFESALGDDQRRGRRLRGDLRDARARRHRRSGVALALDEGVSFLRRSRGRPSVLEPRAGDADRSRRQRPVGFSVDGGKVTPGRER